jgi:hypothetical protein
MGPVGIMGGGQGAGGARSDGAPSDGHACGRLQSKRPLRAHAHHTPLRPIKRESGELGVALGARAGRAVHPLYVCKSGGDRTFENAISTDLRVRMLAAGGPRVGGTHESCVRAAAAAGGARAAGGAKRGAAAGGRARARARGAGGSPRSSRVGK